MIISIQAVVQTVVYLLICGAIFWLLNYLISAVGVPDPFAKFARLFLLVAAVLILIGILLSFLGVPLIQFRP